MSLENCRSINSSVLWLMAERILLKLKTNYECIFFAIAGDAIYSFYRMLIAG